MIITEFELRANWHKKKAKVITVPPGSVLTPSARDFLRSKGIQIQIEGDGLQDLNQHTLSTAGQSLIKGKVGENSVQTKQGGCPKEISDSSSKTVCAQQKPEHMTHLYGNHLVNKTHPVIAWRGQLDLFDCALTAAQVHLVQLGEEELAAQLEEVAQFARQIMVAEVRNDPLDFGTLLGWTPEQIRDMSHHPDRYFGISHTPMSYKDGPVVACLNGLRSKVREVELYAARAMAGENNECKRTDIILALNRLSSLFYVLVCKIRGGAKDQKKCLPIGVSNRHVHLSQQHLEVLFGKGYELQNQKDLSQPGQFAAKETVNLEGTKGSIDHVRILGPVRSNTQVEISATDSFRLGVKPVVRDSGQHEGTSGIRLTGPKGTVEIAQGVIVAARHIHMHSDQAKQWGLKDGQRLRVKVESERPVIFQDVLVRVSPKFQGEIHLDTDEANAALVNGKTQGILMGV